MLGTAPSPAEEIAPLKPGKRFDYSKYAFQPESWKKRYLSLQLIPWTEKNGGLIAQTVRTRYNCFEFILLFLVAEVPTCPPQP